MKSFVCEMIGEEREVVALFDLLAENLQHAKEKAKRMADETEVPFVSLRTSEGELCAMCEEERAMKDDSFCTSCWIDVNNEEENA